MPARPLRPLLVLTALLALPSSLGQTAPPASAPPAAPSTTAPANPAPAPTPSQRRTGAANSFSSSAFSAAEQAALQALFEKGRPASLRIEQCPAVNCGGANGLGSGVLISADGLALTAYHVIRGASALSALTLDGERHAVTVVGYDDQMDLALLKVAVPAGTPFLPLAQARPGVGDLALAIGNAGGRFLQPKAGKLTALDAAAGRADFPPGTLELSAPLAPGDSGGPVLNARGEVAGISSYIRLANAEAAWRRQEAPLYRGHAVPVTATDALVLALKAGEKRDAPIIGIAIRPPFDELVTLSPEGFARISEVLKLGQTPGAFFTDISQGSPAERAGLQPLEFNDDFQRTSGDIVTEVNGKRIVNFSEFQYAVRSYKPGDTVTLTVLRGAQTLKVPVTLIGRSLIRN